jgi:cobalamin biosynthesis protein CobD/CbiB
MEVAMNYVGFLRWQFRGCFTSPTFWGFLALAVATVLMLFAAPTALTMTVAATGAGLVILDAGISWFRFSYSIYEMEKRDVERQLQRKDLS